MNDKIISDYKNKNMLPSRSPVLSYSNIITKHPKENIATIGLNTETYLKQWLNALNKNILPICKLEKNINKRILKMLSAKEFQKKIRMLICNITYYRMRSIDRRRI